VLAPVPVLEQPRPAAEPGSERAEAGSERAAQAGAPQEVERLRRR
jgi:hypothetical protein